MREIKIGTRTSKLALVQTKIVSDYIEKKRDYQVKVVGLITTGDKILDRSLDKIGGKGLFVKELDQALFDGRSDLSVHCVKDLPMEIPEELPILGYLKRADARDVLVLPKGTKTLDFSLPIGTSSKRRALQFKELYPEAKIKSIRGNVLTRLEKLDSGEFAGIILAAAGLKRLGLEDRITSYFSAEEMIPAVGQGILAIQGRKKEDYSYLEDLFDKEARDLALCERAFVIYLNGGCTVPMGAYAEILDEKTMKFTGFYHNEETGLSAKESLTGTRQKPQELGIAVAKILKQRCSILK